MTLRVFHAIALASGVIIAPQLAAQTPTETATTAAQTPIEARADQVVALINGGVQPEDIFTDGFRAAVADARVKALSASLTAQMGPAVYAELQEPHDGTRAALQVRFERGIAKGGIAIDPAQDNRVSELRFTSVEALTMDNDAPEKITADLSTLPGTVNAWFAPLDGGTPVISMGTDTPLALGSAFKLYVLAALAEDVKAGRRSWSDVVPLTEKSFPSGQMQNWPEGSPVTLHTLASLMISISDNTATDQLIAVLGKARILKLMADSGQHNIAMSEPFLNTRELFVTKASDGLIDLLKQWRSGNEDALDVYLTLLNAPEETPSLETITAAFANGPKALEIEWFASPADLGRLFAYMRRTADPMAFAIMAINPAASEAVKADWSYVGFKGGSEPGVINLTWLLTDKGGRDWLLTLGWNNPAAPVEDSKFLSIAQRILLLPH